MAFADWLLPLLLLTPDDGHGCELFDWGPPEPSATPVVPAPIAAPV